MAFAKRWLSPFCYNVYANCQQIIMASHAPDISGFETLMELLRLPPQIHYRQKKLKQIICNTLVYIDTYSAKWQIQNERKKQLGTTLPLQYIYILYWKRNHKIKMTLEPQDKMAGNDKNRYVVRCEYFDKKVLRMLKNSRLHRIRALTSNK